MDANDKFFSVGLKSPNLTFTNVELEEQIEVLKLVIAYLSGRRDCDIVLYQLRRDLVKFEEFLWARGLKK